MAENELAAFVSAVSELFGSTEAQQSAKDWMKIVTLMCCQTRGASPDWRRVTITAAGRLASRVQFSDPGCFETRGTKRPFLVTRLFSQKRNNGYREGLVLNRKREEARREQSVACLRAFHATTCKS